MFRATWTTTVCLAITILSTRASATELLPGETLNFSAVDTTTVNDRDVTATPDAGTFFTQALGNDTIAAPIFYGTLRSAWAYVGSIAPGAPPPVATLFYSFHNVIDTDGPGEAINPPDNATLSFSGFGALPIDVSQNLTYLPNTVQLQSIARSTDGNTLTLIGFHDFNALPSLIRDTPEIVLNVIGNATITHTAATLDFQNGTALTADTLVLTPSGASLPEPTSLLLLPLAFTALALRHSRRVIQSPHD